MDMTPLMLSIGWFLTTTGESSDSRFVRVGTGHVGSVQSMRVRYVSGTMCPVG
jgi:hypothetical protein